MGWMLAAVLIAQMGGAGMETVAHDLMSGVDRPQQVVVQDDTVWARIWRAHAGDALPPHVDFTTRTALAVFLGTRTSGGFEAEITGLRKEGSVTVVEWVERRPQPGHVAAMVITSPALIVTVPKIQGEVRFEQVAPDTEGR